MSFARTLRRSLRRFSRNTEGGISVLSLQLFLMALLIGGLALDTGNALSSRFQLQMAADSAAHAALYTRELASESDARAAAHEIVEASMPKDSYGVVLSNGDIQFGTWDHANQRFTRDESSVSAVKVTARRDRGRSNGLETFFLRIIGFFHWDMASTSIYETYLPACLKAGFVSGGPLTLSGPQVFPAGFCLHSNDHVILATRNGFDAGARISMPDRARLETKQGEIADQPGLAEALRDQAFQLRAVHRLAEIEAGLLNKDSRYWRPYITSDQVVRYTASGGFGPSSFATGTIYSVSCDGDQKLVLGTDIVLLEVVLLTNCPVIISNGGVIHDSVIVTTSTRPDAIATEAGAEIGRADNCEPGGEAQLLSHGGADLSRGVSIHGGQIIAAGAVKLNLPDGGIEDLAVVAGASLALEVKGPPGYCKQTDGAGKFLFSHFRLAQ